MSEEKKEPVVMPERRKTFTFNCKDKKAAYEVEFPNTNGLMEIEVLKVNLSRNQYQGIASSGTLPGNYVALLIDMIAVFNVLFPNLKKDLAIETISAMDVLDSKKLVKIYVKEVLPWMSAWMQILSTDDDE